MQPHHPLPCTTTLASPRKRGGGTADIIFWFAVQYSDSLAFMILKLFRAVTVGIVNALEAFMVALLSISIPFAPHQPFQNRTIPLAFRNAIVYPFIQFINHSQVCSQAHSSAFGTASPQDRYKAPK